MISENNSILQKATLAKEKTEIANAKEQAKLDIMEWIAYKTSKSENATLDNSKIKEILTGKSYVKNANTTSFITAKGNYEIPYSELYNIVDELPDMYDVEANGTWLMDQNEYAYFKYEGNYYIITYNQTEGGCESIRRTTESETATLERLFNIEEGDWIIGWVYKDSSWQVPYFNDKFLGYDLDWYYNTDYRRR